MKIVWATDLHLDHSYTSVIKKFYNDVNNSRADILVITGDISSANYLEEDLQNLEENIDADIYFVLGNHDFYGASFSSVRASLVDYDNYLTNNKIVTLTDGVALIGHDGWYDLRNGTPGKILMNDFRLISEFKPFYMYDYGLDIEIQKIADEAADYIYKTLKEAIEDHDEVFMITHIPPFANSAFYKGRVSGEEFLPYYSSKIMGEKLLDIMINNPDKKLTVLCGHTHDEGKYKPLKNLEVFTGGTFYGLPELQKLEFIRS